MFMHINACQYVFNLLTNMSSNGRGIVKESRVELSVREGGREGGREVGNFWFIEVLTHLKKH